MEEPYEAIPEEWWEDHPADFRMPSTRCQRRPAGEVFARPATASAGASFDLGPRPKFIHSPVVR
jgi:hypothetical protein